jgi:hypothetical protein
MIPYSLLCVVFTALGLTFVRKTGGKAPDVSNKVANDEKRIEGEQEEEEGSKVEIPFTPVTLSFQDLGYEVTASTSKEKLMLLKKVNGVFRPGQMCALMVRCYIACRGVP